MSYDINIWSTARAELFTKGSLNDIGQVLRQLSALSSTDADRLLFSKLGQLLKEDYSAGSEAAAYRETFLNDLEIEGSKIENALWIISIYGEERGKTLFTVIKHAQTLELTVYDDQVGFGVGTGGKVIPQEQAQFFQSDIDRLLHQPVQRFGVPYIKKNIVTPIKKKLKRLGFQFEKNEFENTVGTRGDGIILQEVVLELMGDETEGDDIYFMLHMYICVPEVSRISQLVLKGSSRATMSIYLSEYTRGTEGEEFTSEAQVHRLLETVDDQMIRFLEQSKTLPGINDLIFTEEGRKLLPIRAEILTSEAKSSDTFTLNKCILAGVAGNPRLEEIVKQAQDLYFDVDNEWHLRTRAELSSVLAYFKNPKDYESPESVTSWLK